MELLNAKPEMLIFGGFVFISALFIRLLRLNFALDKSSDIHPRTLEELQIGPSTTTLFLFADNMAIGQAPKTLHKLRDRSLELLLII